MATHTIKTSTRRLDIGAGLRELAKQIPVVEGVRRFLSTEWQPALKPGASKETFGDINWQSRHLPHNR